MWKNRPSIAITLLSLITLFPSATPTLNCSTYLHTITLKHITIRYVSTTTHLSVELSTPATEGYLGFAVPSSSDARMSGGDSVIGLAPDDVKRYRLSYDSAELLGEEEQSLENATFVRGEDTGSVLRFTRRLEHVGSGHGHSVVGDGENTFIWAIGWDGYLSAHKYYGKFTVDLSPCIEGQNNTVVDPPVVKIGKEPVSNEQLFLLHGALAVLAFGILMPLSVAASRARTLLSNEVRGTKIWFLVHTYGNGLAYCMTLVLVGVAMAAYGRNGKVHFANGGHEVVGLVTVVLMTVQVAAGVFRPGTPPSPPPAEGKEGVETEAERGGDVVGERKGGAPENQTGFGDDTERSESTIVSERKSNRCAVPIRVVWRYTHIVMGTTTFVCGLYQLHTGLTLFEKLYRSRSYIRALWISLGCLLAFLGGVSIYAKKKRS